MLIIKKRKGFIKLAIENGADLVPVFSFGETGRLIIGILISIHNIISIFFLVKKNNNR